MRRYWRVAVGVALVSAGVFWRLKQPAEIDPLPDAQIIQTVALDADSYKLADNGQVYRVNPGSGRWSYVATAFDPQVVARAYAREGETIYRCDPDQPQRRFPVLRQFADGFEDVPEGAAGLRRLIGEERMWTEFTPQSPLAPDVPDYVALRQRILGGESDFLDASVAPSRARARTGVSSLKCFCPAKSPAMICAKASLSNALVYFVEGDDVWYQAWYYIEGSVRPFTLVDLEADLAQSAPGIRLMLFDEGELGVELKAMHKPMYRQAAEGKVTFPTDRWVKVTWYVRLDSEVSGRVRVWQDDRLVVDATGQTLPFRTAVYNNLEVGISAHSFGDQPATLYVDDVQVTTKALVDGE
jgi:hypothetical protein